MNCRSGIAALCLAIMGGVGLARADDLFSSSAFAGMSTDRSAAHVGDILTVIVYQNAEARNAAQNTSRQRHTFDGAVHGGETNESAGLALDNSYAGQGEVRRSESFVTQISVVIESVLPNGDFAIAGEQVMHINGERTTVRVRGVVRPSDIMGANQVLSTRIANAEITYDGRGFVSRNARPGLVHRLLGFLGMGG